MTRSLAIRLVYAACLIVATGNHALTLLRHGLFWDYGGMPPASAVFWTSLTFLDPIAAMLLLVRANIGVGMTAAIIIADVTHNLWIRIHYAPPAADMATLFGDPFLLCQIAFLIFVTVTMRYARINSPPRSG